MATSNTEISASQRQGAELGPLLPIESPNSSPAAEPLPTTETKRCLPSDLESDDDGSPTSPSKKARTTAIPPKRPNIAEENALLLELKDEKSMKWPEIVEAFRQHGWANRKAGLLKNRYKSLKEGTVFWEDDDVDLMHQAIFQVEREYERAKWDNVAEKMIKLGSSRKFTGAACEKKFRAKAESKKKNSDEERSPSEAASD